MADKAVGLSFKAKDEVSPVVRGIRKNMARFKSDAAKGFGLGAGMAIFGMGTRAIKGVINALGDAVTAGRAEEANMQKLYTAIRANVRGWNENANAIEAYFSEVQNSLAFADTDLRSSMAALIAVTKDVKESMEVQAIAMDLARFKAIDLRTATDLLVRVYAGNFGTLSRYGIIVDKNATKTEALAAIQEQAAGQAETYGNTSQAAAEKASMAWGDVSEKIGMMLSGSADGFDSLSLSVAGVVDSMLPGASSAAFNESIDTFLGVTRNADGSKRGIDLISDFFTDTVGVDLAPVTTRLNKFTEGYKDFMTTAGVSPADVNGVLKRVQAAFLNGGMGAEEAWAAAEAVVSELLHNMAMSAEEGLNAGNGIQEGFEGARTSIIDTVTSVEGLQSALQAVASGELRSGKGQKDKRKQFKDQMKGADNLGKTIRKLRGDEEFWEKALTQAVKNKNKAAAATALTELQAARKKLADARKVRKALRDEEKLLEDVEGAIETVKEEAALPAHLKMEVDDSELEAAWNLIQDIKGTANAYIRIGIRPTSTRSQAATGGPRAAGGDTAPGETYTVGEYGKETLTMGSRGGTITPNGALGSGGGHSHAIILDGRQVARTVDERLGRGAGRGRGSSYRST